jgi:hypothetical protein
MRCCTTTKSKIGTSRVRGSPLPFATAGTAWRVIAATEPKKRVTGEPCCVVPLEPGWPPPVLPPEPPEPPEPGRELGPPAEPGAAADDGGALAGGLPSGALATALSGGELGTTSTPTPVPGSRVTIGTDVEPLGGAEPVGDGLGDGLGEGLGDGLGDGLATGTDVATGGPAASGATTDQLKEAVAFKPCAVLASDKPTVMRRLTAPDVAPLASTRPGMPLP